ncbi:uncharacterized protein LOC142982799 [Anticarsia gemmatalis]|uniref:uncharacterized protein LOC142982799 n=1 Tax=Anticarsia gemmatalis TaxID=129554 RepID=UPI003F76BE61
MAEALKPWLLDSGSVEEGEEELTQEQLLEILEDLEEIGVDSQAQGSQDNYQWSEDYSLFTGRQESFLQETRETIAKVYDFLKKDARDILELIYLLAEGKESDSKFKSPHKDRKKRLKKLELDNFNVDVIRSTIQNYHLEYRELPTLLKLKRIFQEKLNYEGSISTLRTALLKLRYKWRKTVDNRRVIIERHDIQKLRFSYLNNLLRYRQENRCIVYTDESYILTNHVQNKGWGNKDGPTLKRNLSKGQRIIIVHASSEQGFVPNALLTYKANSVSGDYHSNMNAENYEKWLKERLVPNLPPNSVVVLDNASYHNVQNDRAPNSNSKKIEMQRWLTEKNIAFNQDMKKIELYDLIKKNKENHRVMAPVIDMYPVIDI